MKTAAEAAAKQRRRARKDERGPLVGMDVVFEDEQVRITRTGSETAARAILVFTGVGQHIGKLAPEEFVGSAQREDSVAYFLTDKTCSWFNAFPPERITDVLSPLLQGKTVYTLGNSMGGYGAIWISKYLKVDTVLAFGAQYSVHPEIVPTETRWTRLRDAIPIWRDLSLDGHFMPQTRYITINGDEDELQHSLFPDLSNTTHYVLEGVDHNVPSFLKEGGRLPDVMDCVFDGTGSLADILGPMCRLRGQEPAERSLIPATTAKPEKTAEHREARQAIKERKLAEMTPEELAWRDEKRAKKRAAKDA